MPERGQEWLVRDHPRVDRATAASLEPLETPAPLPVHRLRRPVDGSGRALALEHQLSRPRAFPEWPHDRILDVGQRVVGVNLLRICRHHAARSRSALVATPEAPVTSVARQSGTWLVEVPRICRTASTIRLKPWT